jgi:hypothetical protein
LPMGLRDSYTSGHPTVKPAATQPCPEQLRAALVGNPPTDFSRFFPSPADRVGSTPRSRAVGAVVGRQPVACRPPTANGP